MSKHKKQDEPDDVLGILSLVAAFSGFSVVGLILGLMGASKAKKAGYSVVVSRAGWITSLVITAVFVLVMVAFVVLYAVST